MAKNLLLRQHSQLLSLGAEIEKLLLTPGNEEKLAEKFNDYIDLVGFVAQIGYTNCIKRGLSLNRPKDGEASREEVPNDELVGV